METHLPLNTVEQVDQANTEANTVETNVTPENINMHEQKANSGEVLVEK